MLGDICLASIIGRHERKQSGLIRAPSTGTNDTEQAACLIFRRNALQGTIIIKGDPVTPTERAQAEIKRFLSTEDAETLCFSGQWGVGKTYTWQTILMQAANAGEVGLKRYAYVSLFGINSLDD
jgi:hypothetical protein